MDEEMVYFTEEDLKSFVPFVKDIFYAYYDKSTGNVLCISNEKNPKYEYSIEITKEEALPFLEGKLSIKSYTVTYSEGSKLSLVEKNIDHFDRKSNVFEKVSRKVSDSEFVIEWNSGDGWAFYINPDIKDNISNQGLTKNVLIFISAEHDLNQLIRTITIDTDKLIAGERIVEPFLYKKERDIDNLVVSSKLIFETYSLVTT